MFGAADRAGDVVKMPCLLIEIHRSMGRVDQLVVAAAFQVKMSSGLDLAGRFVVGNFVRADDVVAVVDLDFAGQRPHVAALALLLGRDPDRNALIDGGNDLGDGDLIWRLFRASRFD